MIWRSGRSAGDGDHRRRHMAKRGFKFMIGGALVGASLAVPVAAFAQTSDADKIARLEQETQALQRQLKQLQNEIIKTKKKADKVEAAQAAAPSPVPGSLAVPASSLAVPVALAAPAAGGAAQSSGSDKGSSAPRDPLPDTITWHGVTLYGTVDVGYAFNSNGVPASGSFYVGADTTIYGSRYAYRNVSTITNNALEQSKVGLKFEESLGFYDLVGIGKIETGFNPLSGEISDACASLLRNNGRLYQQQDVNGDGSRCGQAFNGAAYGGISQPFLGTLTVGRQNSLVNDGMGTYDPMALSYAFSLIGYSGTPGGGIGSTETARWDELVKYIFTYGPFHAAGMYTTGGQETPMVADGYGANAGFTWKGFSVDGYYTKENGAVNLSTYSPVFYGGASNAYNTTNTSGSACGVGLNGIYDVACPNALRGTITNNEAWDVMAKYTFELWGSEPSLKDDGTACGFKDDCPPPPPPARLTFYGGFQQAQLSNPSHLQNYYNGFVTIGGYQYFTTTSTTAASSANLPYYTDRILDTAWAGARFETGPWAVTGAWYYWSQNSYITGASFGSNKAEGTCAYITAGYATTPLNSGGGLMAEWASRLRPTARAI